MKRRCRFICVGFSLLLVSLANAAQSETLLKMQVGQVRVLAIPDVARVAVGDGHVLNAVTTEEKEVIVFARNQGSSAMQIWSHNGNKRLYQVEVAPEGARQTQLELQGVLERIPNTRVSQVGDKLLVEGSNVSDNDRERIGALAKRYPQLLDFTSTVGWDRMVLLDVQVVEVPRAQLQELGVRWNPGSTGGLNAGLAWDGGSKRLDARPGETPLALPFPATVAAGYFGINALLSARINAMAQTGAAVVLAQPQLLARSGATAEFLAGGEVPYSTVDANGNTNTAFKPYGVSLRITPRVEGNGAVRSRIEVEVSSVDSSLSMPNGPSLKTRRAATEFNVLSGQTLVLAGFLSREESRNIDQIPGLGNVPVLGPLFRSNRYQRHETELAIFVTPVVVEPDHPDMQQRVQQSQNILDATFSQKALINVPVRPVSAMPVAILDDKHTGWTPWDGVGTQWQDAEILVSPLSPLSPAASQPLDHRGINQHDFTE